VLSAPAELGERFDEVRHIGTMEFLDLTVLKLLDIDISYLHQMFQKIFFEGCHKEHHNSFNEMRERRQEGKRYTLLFLHDKLDNVLDDFYALELKQVLRNLLSKKLLVVFWGLQMETLPNEVFVVLEKTFQPLVVSEDCIDGVEDLKEGCVEGLAEVHLMHFFIRSDALDVLSKDRCTSGKFSWMRLRYCTRNSILSLKNLRTMLSV
jgi:hypothetical protein